MVEERRTGLIWSVRGGPPGPGLIWSDGGGEEVLQDLLHLER